jgi:hypothetical protein
VVTSGLGGVFPRGIPIGKVGDVADEEAEWRKSFWLEPQVAVGSVTLALVAMAEMEPQEDLAPGWEDTGYLREDERVEREKVLQDALDAARDSLAALKRPLRPPGEAP